MLQFRRDLDFVEQLDALGYDEFWVRRASFLGLGNHRLAGDVPGGRRRAHWDASQVTVIDIDQGQSGASAADREGFQQMVAEVSLGRAGIVLGLERSRLARNNADWHQLLEICAMTGTLICDEDGLYDPRNFNDRLVLRHGMCACARPVRRSAVARCSVPPALATSRVWSTAHWGCGADRRAAPYRPARKPARAGADGRGGTDHQRRDRVDGDLLLHPGRAARRPLVGTGDRCRGRGRSSARARSPVKPPPAWTLVRPCGHAQPPGSDGRVRRTGHLCADRAQLAGAARNRGDVSLFDAIAVLIATFTLGQLPIGPSLGPAAAVLILGSHGVATVAAAGVLLTATATVGSLCYAAWALADHFGARRPALGIEPTESPEPAVTAIPA